MPMQVNFPIDLWTRAAEIEPEYGRLNMLSAFVIYSKLGSEGS